MRKFSSFVLLLGFIIPSFPAHAMLRTLFTRLKKPHIQQITPPDYYNYDYYHSDYRMQKWQKRKDRIKKSLETATSLGDYEAIQNIVNYNDTIDGTPLLEAVDMNDGDFVTFLLENRANLKSKEIIFRAQTLEMVKILHDNGADIHTDATNLLHSAVSCHRLDSRIFNYLLLQGIDPEKNTIEGNNLWHSFIGIFHPGHCPSRVKKLHELTINPYRQNKKGKSALDMVEERIIERTKSFDLIKDSNTKFLFSDGTIKLEKDVRRDDINNLIKLYDDMKVIKTAQFIERE
jgi:hypothetical protein